MKFRDLKIGIKQAFGFGLIVLIISVVNLYSIWEMRKIKTDFEDVKTKWLPSVMAIAELNNLTSDIRLIQLQHAFATTGDSKARYERIMLDLLNQITENQDKYEPLISDSLEQEVYTEFEDQWGRYVELGYEFVDFSRVNENIKAVALLNDESLDVWEDFNENLVKLVEINKKGSYDAAERAEKAFISTRNVSIILLIVTVILSIMLAGALVRFIGEPVRQLVIAAKKVAEGDFSHRINVCSRDEIGILAETFNQMTCSLDSQGNEIEKQQLELVAKNNQLEQKTLTLESQKNEIEQKNLVLEDTMHKLNDAHQQLVMQEKMASLGNLVAGVAHEINNPVGAINSAADVSTRAINKIEKSLSSEITQEDIHLQKAMRILKENNSIALTASKRVVNIVKTLKNFARLDEAEYKKADIHEGIESTLTLVNHKLKNRINVIKEFGNIPVIDCYPNQLNQVFMNLFVNAAQAIENEGTITIKTYSDTNHVCIEIIDTGKGIPKNEIAYIFDPGFTTKGVGVGTGLGLSISYNIIQKHNGEIKAESKPGSGTTFTIVLPSN